MQIKVNLPDSINMDEFNVGRLFEIQIVCRSKGNQYLIIETDPDRFINVLDRETAANSEVI